MGVFNVDLKDRTNSGLDRTLIDVLDNVIVGVGYVQLVFGVTKLHSTFNNSLTDCAWTY